MAEGGLTRVWQRVRRVLLRARSAQRRRASQRTWSARLATAAVLVVTGLLVVVSATHARGIDLRPGRNTDLVSLVQSESHRNTQLTAEVTRLRAEVDQLAAAEGSTDSDLAGELAEKSALVGLTPVTGPSVTVTLTDAPASVAGDGVDQDLLVVHQQDIQSVANELWRGGAEAMTIQGQRVIATTGIKCVGNTVVLHGVPYAPPYEIVAIGDQARLEQALADSAAVTIYRQYVDAYGLGFSQRREAEVTLPAYRGSLDIEARRIG